MNKTRSPSQQVQNMSAKPWWQRRVWRATLLHSLEFVALLMALVMAIFGGLAWRLSQGPISLEFLRKDAESALEQVFEGGHAKIGALQADWSRQERTLVVAASDVEVLDAQGRVLVHVPRFDVGLSALGLLQRKMQIQRIIARGGEFSVVRKADGRVGAGLGKPEQVVFNKAQLQAIDTSTASIASLPQILSRLRVLAMRDTTLHFVDERAGVNWTSPHADIRFNRNGDRLTASANGKIESAAGMTGISVDATSRTDFTQMSASFTLSNAVPAALLPIDEGPLHWLSAIDAPLNAQVTFATNDEGLLKNADGHLTFSKGNYRQSDRVIQIENAEIVFQFDPVDGAISIELAQWQSSVSSGNLKGRLIGLDPARLAVGEQIGFDLEFENLVYDPNDVFEKPLEISRFWIDGYFLPQDKTAQFKHFSLSLADFSLLGSADLTFPDANRDENAPLLRLQARSDGQIIPAQVVALWPVKFARGGRDWIRRNVLAGQLHEFVMDVNLPQKVLNAERLDNDMLTLSFAFDEAQSHFVNAMTPLRDGEGTAVLRGNRFDLIMEHARLRDLELTNGFVEIPRLSPKGVTAHFGGHAEGSLGDVVKLLDEPPLGFVSRYGLSPDTITGQGMVDFSISRPMRVQVSPRKIGFIANGVFDDIRVAGLIAGQDLSGISARFTAKPEGMVVAGEGKLGSVPGRFVWNETFFPVNEPRTQLEIDVTADAKVFDDLGIPTRLFVDGPMDIHLITSGEGKNIASAKLEADLTSARLMSPRGDWEKPTGQPGHASLLLGRRKDGGYDISDFEAQTEGFTLKGNLSITAEGGVQSARISQASMEGLFDFTADLQRDMAGAFVLKGHAKSLDARGFVRGLTQGASTDLGFGLVADFSFDRALASDSLTLRDGYIHFKRGDQDIEYLDFSSATPNGNAVFSIKPDEANVRQLTGRSDDAGMVIEALFGANSVHNGTLEIAGVLGDDSGRHTRLNFTMQDFKLGNVPVMARMLSLGSLTGIANTMSGEGLGFKKLIAPLEFHDGKVDIGAARATGPALGVTVSGSVDLVEKNMDLNGALAPAYSLNSALGKLPLIGKALVSRKGEGLIGLSYSVKGPFDALQVFVNPLSALTPGVFRRIFEGGVNPAEVDQVIPGNAPTDSKEEKADDSPEETPPSDGP